MCLVIVRILTTLRVPRGLTVFRTFLGFTPSAPSLARMGRVDGRILCKTVIPCVSLANEGVVIVRVINGRFNTLVNDVRFGSLFCPCYLLKSLLRYVTFFIDRLSFTVAMKNGTTSPLPFKDEAVAASCRATVSNFMFPTTRGRTGLGVLLVVLIYEVVGLRKNSSFYSKRLRRLTSMTLVYTIASYRALRVSCRSAYVGTYTCFIRWFLCFKSYDGQFTEGSFVVNFKGGMSSILYGLVGGNLVSLRYFFRTRFHMITIGS